MDAKTLEKMTVTKLREEAMKFEDLKGVHGMHKPELIKILKQKYGVHEEFTESESLAHKHHAVKGKIKELKAAHAQAIQAKDPKKIALLKERLRRERRLLKKVIKKAHAAAPKK
jgi:hypothetical protein